MTSPSDSLASSKIHSPAPLSQNERVVYALVAVALIITYLRACGELYVNWTLADSYYSHGFLVPFISIFFVWHNREAIARIPRTTATWGFLWIGVAGGLLFLSDFLGFRVFGQASILPMLTGVCLVLQGKARTQRIWFPLAFLFFMIPIPPSVTQSFALRLKLLATECAVQLANLATLPLIRQGSTVHFKGDDFLLVGDVCGGLRSLIALLALGALAAYVSKTRPWSRALILLIAGPIAIVANIFRIFLLCVVGHFWGSEAASGAVHTVSGYLIFVVAFALFFMVESLLRRWAPESDVDDAPPPDAEHGPRQPAPCRRTYAIVVVALALLAGGHLAFTMAEDNQAQAPQASLTSRIPDQIVDYRQVGRDEEADDRTQELLQTSSILMRTYTSPTGRPISLSIVYAGTTRRSLHFPEVCFVGEGWDVQAEATAPVGTMFTGKRLVLRKAETDKAVLYWFKTGDYLTGNFFLNAFYWTKFQLTFDTPTSSMIRLSTPLGSDGAEPAFDVLDDFATKLAPILLSSID